VVNPGDDVHIDVIVLGVTREPLIGVSCHFSVDQPNSDATVDPEWDATDNGGHAHTVLMTGSAVGSLIVEAECAGRVQQVQIQIAPAAQPGALPWTGQGVGGAPRGIFIACTALFLLACAAATWFFLIRRAP
jgi:hypothetical protein